MRTKFTNTIFKTLFTSNGLKKLDQDFLNYVRKSNLSTYKSLLQLRKGDVKADSEFIISLSIILESFLSIFFNINKNLKQHITHISNINNIFEFRKYYVRERAMKNIRKPCTQSYEELDKWLINNISKYFPREKDAELAVAKLGNYFLKYRDKYAYEIELLVMWCLHILQSKSLGSTKSTWFIFSAPLKMDYDNLVPCYSLNHKKVSPEVDLKFRDGFKLTDSGMSTKEVLNQISNCMFCHKHDGDYCSKGFPLEKNSKEFAKNALNNTLTGCPLNIKISEMIFLQKHGHSIASLATLMIDNPLCPLTGYRICNDCMKSCIYQKHEPVHVPQIESKILKDVLTLPWGFEIYDLLTRWNPLLFEHWLPQPFSGNKVLVIGAGPSGITMSYYLLQRGCAVVIMDGLKIEPLSKELINKPIKSLSYITEELDNRISWGFGGVAQYGITSRWDKNFLKLIYISLVRREHFKIIGNVRFGGTITVEEAWQQKFDHIVIASGAGLPKELPIFGSLAPGMYQANDFLMSLHLTGMTKLNSVIAYQVQLPVIIIGGGLTAIDTATEVQAYYINQIENVLSKYEEICNSNILLDQVFLDGDSEIINELIQHGREVRQERIDAKKEGRIPNFIPMIRKWGGVTIAYRGTMKASPAYRSNYEELLNALQEGVLYIENYEPKEAILDKYGNIKAIKGLDKQTNEILSLEARSIFIATGTNPNVAYEYEHKGTFERGSFGYKTYKLSYNTLQSASQKYNLKEKCDGIFTSYCKDNKFITFIGDTHPLFHGSVVKAIAGAKQAYPEVLKALKIISTKSKGTIQNIKEFYHQLEQNYSQQIHEVKKVNNILLKLTIKAPQAARMFYPGQFYRLQQYETDPIYVNNKIIFSKPITIFPTSVDKKNGILIFHIFQDNPYNSLISCIKPGQNIALMGPTGARINILQNETIIVFGDRISLGIMSTIGPAFKKKNCKVIYIVKIASPNDYFDQDWSYIVDDLVYYSEMQEIENKITKNSGNFIKGNLNDVIASIAILFHKQKVTNNIIKELPNKIDSVFFIGEAEFVHYAKNSCIATLATVEVFKNSQYFSYTLGPMQCMLKGICGQCLQWQIDPLTKKRTKAVFACSWQCQPMDIVDFDHLFERSKRNLAIEKLQSVWFNAITLQSNSNIS